MPLSHVRDGKKSCYLVFCILEYHDLLSPLMLRPFVVDGKSSNNHFVCCSAGGCIHSIIH